MLPKASVELELRTATIEDAPLAADLDTIREPQDPRDPVLMRHWWTDFDPGERVTRRIMVRDGVAMALVTAIHRDWEPGQKRFGFIRARLHPDIWSDGRFAALVKIGEQWLRDEGATVSVFRCRDYLPLELEASKRAGYREVRRGRISELDLGVRRESILASAKQARDTMRERGVDLTVYAEYDEPDKAERLYRLETQTEQDIPTTVPIPVLKLEAWTARRFGDPAVREDRIWLALDDGELVGLSQLGYPVVRGFPYTDYTATARRVRGRGIARALKYQSMAQALELGFTIVRTMNDAENAPILHLNQEMGYRLAFEEIELHRELGA
jgi:GNAT superfamily N-acetyltransferase